MKNHQGNRGGGGWKGGDRKFGAGSSYGKRDDRGFDRPQLHRATCVACGDGCEVPFKPNGSKPVFCRDCFRKDGDGGAPKRFDRRDDRGFERDRKPMFRTDCASCGDSCEVPFKPNGSKPVYCRNCFDRNGDAPSAPRFERKTAPAAHACRHEDEFRSLNAKLDMILKRLTPSAPKDVAAEEPKKAEKAAVKKAVKEKKDAKASAKKKAPAKKKSAAKKK